ncbi:SGNH/GDSL hydrolase family protein [Kaistia dalseonensis]|uniref:Lysophospholipase L1-like esterase n=1 Tax=Kaistia dalseonensis TaxID=410840 RepID=A0ABU0H8J2_9HYPH|nr:SGNH/GDSL hydrolase family protein [Kaistia dalseonensis]MCX5496028.1 SGNH/GDSL hydrolase family protein [Kaistia dalseonensis]MDQ0438632.1 lysophospholipase L1-like esterase [Kaistia dalseonensis]
MKTILAYGDSNTWGAEPQPYRGGGGRFAPDKRWPGIVRKALGADIIVAEEGLNGRTTCLDDPVEGAHKNGKTFLPVALETHAPIDLVVIKLGTNDLKARLSMQAGDIADGAGKLVDMVLQSAAGPGGRAPAVLLVAPAPLSRLSWLAEMFSGGAEKSQRLAAEFDRVAKARSVALLDAGSIVTSSEIDGIHLDEEGQRVLGLAIAERARALLGLGD